MIQQRIESDYQYVESLGYKVLGVFLQGSQNYGLAYEGSDIDTKCIVLPSFEDFCLNKYKRLFGDQFYEDLMILHSCDKEAH